MLAKYEKFSDGFLDFLVLEVAVKLLRLALREKSIFKTLPFSYRCLQLKEMFSFGFSLLYF